MRSVAPADAPERIVLALEDHIDRHVETVLTPSGNWPWSLKRPSSLAQKEPLGNFQKRTPRNFRFLGPSDHRMGGSQKEFSETAKEVTLESRGIQRPAAVTTVGTAVTARAVLAAQSEAA